ncbi:unnamed protein product [Albugo candida]|uniref:Uncharacterized protein n=1 Tax=Albugo candida TaxID=65357 RepID=A0A024FXY0_9STRA|nr:unnamed protein product [Albugo candida]|eukprot:CCI39419.1 unnamed protein product [Albugo candida]
MQEGYISLAQLDPYCRCELFFCTCSFFYSHTRHLISANIKMCSTYCATVTKKETNRIDAAANGLTEPSISDYVDSTSIHRHRSSEFRLDSLHC